MSPFSNLRSMTTSLFSCFRSNSSTEKADLAGAAKEHRSGPNRLVRYDRNAIYPEADSHRMNEPMPAAFELAQAANNLFSGPKDEALPGYHDSNGHQDNDAEPPMYEQEGPVLPPRRVSHPEPYLIYIKTFSGNTFTLQVKSSETINSLRGRLSSESRLPTAGLEPKGFRLNFNGRLLNDPVSIGDYGIDKGDTIDCRWILVGTVRSAFFFRA